MERDSRELQRFPKGSERCLRCRAKRWYQENGLRFCQNGHQIEGYIEFGAEDGDKAGLTNFHTSRKEKEVREVETKRLKGAKGRDLYLECLQYLLRNQVLWLVTEKKHKPELEGIVQDLWDLRIRGCPSLEVSTDVEREDVLFSSSQPAALEDELELGTPTRAVAWAAGPDQKWAVPVLMETLGICYLGCLLLRAPTKIGDIFEWARKNELPYVRAHELIPKSLTERLPQPYPRMLKLPIRVPIQGNQLHATILRLELSYDLNYSLKYPPLNYHLLALDYTQNLGLPVEAVTLVKQFTAFLQITYSLPTTKSRIRLIDQPEVQLISLIVAITKHFFPFTGTSGIQSRPGYLPTIDWAVWAKHMKSHQDETSGVEDYTAISGEDIVSMTQEEEERFLEHVLVFSKADDEENRLINFFPFTRAEKYKPIEKVKTNSSKLSEATVIQAKGVTYTGDTEPVAVPYFSVSDRTVDDLSEEARLFYKLAAAQSGLDVQTLIRAVDMVETQIQSAERQRK